MTWTRQLAWRRWTRIDRRNRGQRHEWGDGEDRARGLGRGGHGHYPRVVLEVFRTGHHTHPAQWRDARLPWGVDLEGWTWEGMWRPDVHVERAFRTRRLAEAFATYLAWCVDQLTDEQLREVGEQNQGRLV